MLQVGPDRTLCGQKYVDAWMLNVEPAAEKLGKHFYMKQEESVHQTLLFKISLFPLLEITGPDQEEQNHTGRNVLRHLVSMQLNLLKEMLSCGLLLMLLIKRLLYLHEVQMNIKLLFFVKNNPTEH